MAELDLLGSLLGLPNLLDPMFPLAFSAFFDGASGGTGIASIGFGSVKTENPVQGSNVSVVYIVRYWYICMCLCLQCRLCIFSKCLDKMAHGLTYLIVFKYAIFSSFLV